MRYEVAGGTENQTIGRYELLTRLAVGGMAEIFLALEHGIGGLERTVVIKRILPQLAGNDHFVEMFLREARIIARLNHPNVVHIHGLGETEEGTPYIAMEYVDGSTARELQVLAQKLGREVPTGVAAGIVAQAARGLHAAHEITDTAGNYLGVVHRDISPHNLMVATDGHVKLLDFGIAKATRGDDATYSGALKGKFSYLSPEQVDKLSLDRRSDVFALGIVLWELLTGRRLFKRATEVEMIDAVRHDEVPPPGTLAAIPRWLDSVTMKALAKDRDERYPTAEAMRLALERAADESLLDFGADAVARFLDRVAGAKLCERAETLRRAREHPLSSIERRQLLPETDTGSIPDIDDDDQPTAVERPSEELPGLDLTPSSAVPAGARRRLVLGAVIGALVLAVVLVVWRTPEEPAGGDVFAGGATVSGDPLPMGWPPTVDTALVLDEMEPLRHYLEAALGRPVPFIVTESYEDCADRLRRGELAFAVLPPLLYVRTRDTMPELHLLAIKQYDGADSYAGWLMVRDDVQAESLSDLRGRTFCYTSESSTSGYFLPRQYLRAQGHDPDRFVGAARFSGQHLQALRDALDGRCDVVATYNGAVYSASDDGLEVGRLQLFATTGRIPQDAVVAAPGVPAEVRARMRDALLAFDPPAHANRPRVGTTQRITGFRAAEDALFEPLRAAVFGGDPEAAVRPTFPE